MGNIRNTDVGFVWNNAEVKRLFGDNDGDKRKYGCYMSVATSKGELFIRVTPSGRIYVGVKQKSSPSVVHTPACLVR